ncbi:MAG: EpsI family protein [Acidobacteriaceae bacterium]|nr:EpsI family protein [Acidobacteriaceae bacterium]
MKSARYWTVVILLLATAAILHIRSDADRVPPSEPLDQVPKLIEGRISQDYPLSDDVLAILGKGDFLNRVYTDQNEPDVPPVSLFIGYFATQRTGQSIHSPQHCLPGAGWTFESQKYVDLVAQDGKKYRVGEYVIANGVNKQFVLYWYQAHGRSVANEYAAKLYMIMDAIRLNRTDGALVRVITPILSTESQSAARERAVQFTNQLAPMLHRFIPN